MQGEKTSLRELAALFTKLGLTAFGGPAAHIAMMQKEVVDKRHWMDHQHFLDLIGATNLIPGPNSTEMAIHIGHERGGWKGLLVAGCCFILPAVLITGVIAWLYKQYGQLPQVQAVYLWDKAGDHCDHPGGGVPAGEEGIEVGGTGSDRGAGAGGSLVAGLNEIFVMFGAGLVVLLLYMARRPGLPLKGYARSLLLDMPFFSEANVRIFLVFLKIGAICMAAGMCCLLFWTVSWWQRGCCPGRNWWMR
jgi:chromate transporter